MISLYFTRKFPVYPVSDSSFQLETEAILKVMSVAIIMMLPQLLKICITSVLFLEKSFHFRVVLETHYNHNGSFWTDRSEQTVAKQYRDQTAPKGTV